MPKAIVYNSLSYPWRRALQMTTLMSNSLQVIAVRTQKIVEASANPLKGDYAELNRMIPEKAEAFSEAAVSLSSDFCGRANRNHGVMDRNFGFGTSSCGANQRRGTEYRKPLIRHSRQCFARW